MDSIEDRQELDTVLPTYLQVHDVAEQDDASDKNTLHNVSHDEQVVPLEPDDSTVTLGDAVGIFEGAADGVAVGDPAPTFLSRENHLK